MNKKLISLLIATSFASLFTVSALSAPVANLKISGDIKPPTCTVNGGDNDLLYSFGNISPTVIPQDATYNGLPELSNNITVTCDAETFLTFKATDNYPSQFINPNDMNSNIDGENFKLVDASNTSKNVGGIGFRFEKISVDGNAAYISRANDGDKDTGTWSGNQTLMRGATNGWTSVQQKYVAPSDLKLQSGKVFSANFTNQAHTSGSVALTYLHSKTMLANDGIDITDGLDYIGQVVLTFNFGI